MLAALFWGGACVDDETDDTDAGEGEGEGDAGGEGEGEGEGVGEWQPMSMDGAPASRYYHSAVWTGTELLVWGGYSGEIQAPTLGSGGRYDPALDEWTPMTQVDAPRDRSMHLAVWTGEELIVWSGAWDDGFSEEHNLLSDGGRYDPEEDTWRAIEESADSPPPILGATAVWTGTEMIVWGAVGGDFEIAGAAYDPDADSWRTLATENAPQGRRSHSAVWTGTEMIIWGGFADGPQLDGARYDPAVDAWAPIPTDGGPEEGSFPAGVVWTGSEMVVLVYAPSHELVVFIYDLVDDDWTMQGTANQPPIGGPFEATWIGDRVAIWGAVDGSYGGPGALYDPASDSWEQMSTRNAPTGRMEHSAVWTSEMLLIWGGQSDVESPDLEGARYLP
jgi:hypothetical protein